MDLSILAGEVKDDLTRAMPKAGAYVKKSRFHDCHDSALLTIRENYVLLGVFDGVSGAPYARLASERALQAVRSYVEKNFSNKPLEELLEAALQEANYALTQGATTATTALILNNGEYYYANVGDSHLYMACGREVKRLTREDRDSSSLTTYLADRMVVTRALGCLLHGMEKGHGRLARGDFLFALTDGFIDNLYIETEGGRVLDTSGKKDLEHLFSKRKTLEEMIQVIGQEIKKRMQHPMESVHYGSVLVPKEDDAAMAILKF